MNSSPLSISDYIVLDVTTNQDWSRGKETRESFEVVANRYLSEINRGVKPTNEAKLIRFPHWKASRAAKPEDIPAHLLELMPKPTGIRLPKATYTRAIYIYLLRVGGRVIYRMYKDKTFPEVLTQNMIRVFFEAIILDKCKDLADEYDDWTAPVKTVITSKDVEHLANSAAAHVFETMTYDRCRALYLERAADGRRGGLQSRRGPSVTKAMLEPQGDRTAEVYYADEAKRLDCSVRTIKRRVAEAKAAQPEVELEQESDDRPCYELLQQGPMTSLDSYISDMRNERVSQFLATDHSQFLDDILAA